MSETEEELEAKAIAGLKALEKFYVYPWRPGYNPDVNTKFTCNCGNKWHIEGKFGRNKSATVRCVCGMKWRITNTEGPVVIEIMHRNVSD